MKLTNLKNFGNNYLLAFHFLICFVGLSILLKTGSRIIINNYLSDNSLNMNAWVKPFLYPDKPVEIIRYVGSVIALFFYFPFYIAYVKNINENSLLTAIKNKNSTFFGYFVALLFCNLMLNVYIDKTSLVLFSIRTCSWIILLLLPSLANNSKFKDKLLFRLNGNVNYEPILNKIDITFKLISYVILVGAFIQIFFIFRPFVFQKLTMINEFLNIPEQTVINKKLVNNSSYYENGKLFQNRDELPIKYREFVDKNKFEIHWQIFNRWVIHHHNHVLGTINELNLGKNTDSIFFQYGWFNSEIIKNILLGIGGINYQNYFKVLFSFYYIYYLLFVGLLFLIFRRIEYVAAGALLSSSALNGIGYEYILLGPGGNPIRHFFDVFVIGFFYLYVTKKKLAFLVLAYVFSLLCILNCSQFGLFALGALLTSLFVKYLCEKGKWFWWKIVLLVMGGVGGCIVYKWSIVGLDYMSGYFLKGLLGFPLPRNAIFWLISSFGLGYYIIAYIYEENYKLKYLGLYALFYLQGLLIYYIWGSDKNHLYVLAPIIILTVALFVKGIIDNTDFKKYEGTALSIAILLSLTAFIPGTVHYYKNKKVYDQTFKTHKTYEWNLPTAHFISTMDPLYFTDSINLMQKYSNRSAIYIISKYDNFLPFLAKKYSAMPYFDVSMYLLSNKEIVNCINTINADKPKYLFVDTDIYRTYEADVIDSEAPIIGYLHKESVSRAQRLKLLTDIFVSVSKDYKPVEKAYLLTVYERKDS